MKNTEGSGAAKGARSHRRGNISDGTKTPIWRYQITDIIIRTIGLHGIIYSKYKTKYYILLMFEILSFLCAILPKNNQMIVIYGRNMLNDNSEALLDYLIRNGYNTKYKLKLIVSKRVRHAYPRKDVDIVTNIFESIYCILIAKYIFHAQGLSKCSHRPNNGQIIFNIWHGSPLKSIGYACGQGCNTEKSTSYFLAASPIFSNIYKISFRLNANQIFIGSNPRNDYLFDSTGIKELLGWDSFSHVIMFMPTFRKGSIFGLYNEGGGDFPILNADNIVGVNTYLEQLNILLVIKPHPAQDNIEFLQGNHSNISIIYNNDIKKKNIRLYQIIGASDALLTDFSSVYFDYLLINKPIGFTINDLEEYGKGRGFSVESPLDLMPGEKISDLNGLINFINNLKHGIDEYEEERQRVCGITNTYKTPDASKRILDAVGIQL